MISDSTRSRGKRVLWRGSDRVMTGKRREGLFEEIMCELRHKWQEGTRKDEGMGIWSREKNLKSCWGTNSVFLKNRKRVITTRAPGSTQEEMRSKGGQGPCRTTATVQIYCDAQWGAFRGVSAGGGMIRWGFFLKDHWCAFTVSRPEGRETAQGGVYNGSHGAGDSGLAGGTGRGHGQMWTEITRLNGTAHKS